MSDRIERDAQKYVERIMDKVQPPVPGKANFLVAVAMKLRMHPQDPDKLLDEIDRLKRVEDEYLGLRGQVLRQVVPDRRSWPCGCTSVGSGTEWLHLVYDPRTGEQVFDACREGHQPGQLFDAWSGQSGET